ncbi:MAG: tRNA (N(6)-L-threonylcarbamoyladenosine(37)-C(2))-methylthiotransferase [Nanoarchaeota archaeon]|nr:tRNA (N(6)-L-threonylcarbamoyladenosine(37)-C(2))-methylthiotransferase [Nanoarchaeota archaeon]MBU1030930.1 tRNA (N(6)-L-threonylcarbamoyladenosine(37)-C(2))-methylthiotransferase [Nanoarchaeota archaeon]MBU1850471.1 tRNA (N(6)-L-threonylcarbamoyladenosine(37)-C(2))-methylthiotransferase [Nanoarchaeota archaeon]
MIKIFFKTYGCAHNQSDSEVMMGLLLDAGHKIVKTKKEADILIYNTCTVKDPSEKKFLSELRNTDKKIVVAGCIPQSEPELNELKNYSLVGVKQIHRIVEVVKETLAGNIVQLLMHTKSKRQNLPKVRRNNLIEIIPLSNGCLGNCAYCKVKSARGDLESFCEDEIIEQFKTAVLEGVKEFWLTSEDTGTYGLDIGTNLPKLLKKILEIPGDYRIRLGMINPQYVKKYLKELITIYKDSRMFKFIHIPVQSGSNPVLKIMNRKYSVSDFKTFVLKLRKNIPNITIATDIICGFPTETDKDFKMTLELVKEFQFPVLNISKFYPRPKTKAALMPLLITEIPKERSKQLVLLNNSLRCNDSWLSWEGDVFVDEKGKNNSFIGRNDFYKLVVLKGEELLGKRIRVKIIAVRRNYLEGEVI